MSKKWLSFIQYSLIWLVWAWLIMLTYTWLVSKTQGSTSTIDQTQYVNMFFDKVQKNGWIPASMAHRKGLITLFCQNIFDKDLIQWFEVKDTQWWVTSLRRFSPRDSLFVLIVCHSVNQQSSNEYNPGGDTNQQLQKELDILTKLISQEKDTIKQAKLMEQQNTLWVRFKNQVELGGKNGLLLVDAPFLKKTHIKDIVDKPSCSRWSNLNSCSVATLVSKLFHQIINDMVNSKVASLYGNMTRLSNQTTETNQQGIYESITNFSDYYFGSCHTSKSSIIYLNPDATDTHCSHPNTFNILSTMMANAYQKTDKNQVIDYGLLLDKGTGTLIGRSIASLCTFTGSDNMTLDCGLDDFRHTIMNELLFYGLFLNRYRYFVPTSQQFGPSILGKDVSSNQEVLDEESRKATMELDIATIAIEQDMKIIRNFFAQFPVHIGLVAYLEDLVQLRNELIKLYTPIHQMYYKLRNAQTYQR